MNLYIYFTIYAWETYLEKATKYTGKNFWAKYLTALILNYFILWTQLLQAKQWDAKL